MNKFLRNAVLWIAGLVGMVLMFLRPRKPAEENRVEAIKAEALRLKAIADEQRARHDAEVKAALEVIKADRAEPVDSVAFANDLLKD